MGSSPTLLPPPAAHRGGTVTSSSSTAAYPGGAALVVYSASEDATVQLAGLLAQQGLVAGDAYLLHGKVGTGKSVFRPNPNPD